MEDEIQYGRQRFSKRLRTKTPATLFMAPAGSLGHDPHQIMTGGRLDVQRAISDAVVAAYSEMYSPGSERVGETPGVFLSYASQNREFVEVLAASFEMNSFPTWFDKRVLNPGDVFPAEIESGIGKSDYLIVVISQESMRSSWVCEEVKAAMRQQKKIFPVVIDGVLSESEEGKPNWFLELKHTVHIEPFVADPHQAVAQFNTKFNLLVQAILKQHQQDPAE